MAKSRIDNEGRECKQCNMFLPWDRFSKHPRGVNGRAATCKACRRKAEPYDYAQEKAQRYGVSVEDIDAIRQAQDGRCFLCDETPDRLVLDHCHATGAVRRLLCYRCNVGLGYFRDDPALFLKAAEYVRAYR